MFLSGKYIQKGIYGCMCIKPHEAGEKSESNGKEFHNVK